MMLKTREARMSPAYLLSWSCLLLSLFFITYICVAV
jgi:hypothetical protein